MIEVANLSKFYGKKKALENISFSVKKGEVLGLLGANGAGKSTMMNIMTGYLASSEGTVSIDGYDILEHPREAKRRIGYLPEQPPLYMDMTVQEYLEFVYELKKIKGTDKAAHILDAVRKVGIEDVYKRRISNLSKGYKQRAGFAQALLGNPEVLILDEPTVGLDPSQIVEIRNLIQTLGKAHTVILSSHILSEVSAVCERVIIIKKGRIVAEDTPQNLSQIRGAARLELHIAGGVKAAEAALRALPELSAVELTAQMENGVVVFEVETKQASDIEFLKRLFYTMAENRLPVVLLKPVETSLEKVFVELMADGQAVAPPAEQTVRKEGHNACDTNP